MSNCYSADHIAEDHIHTDITCNIEELQQKYRLGTVSSILLLDFGKSRNEALVSETLALFN